MEFRCCSHHLLFNSGTSPFWLNTITGSQTSLTTPTPGAGLQQRHRPPRGCQGALPRSTQPPRERREQEGTAAVPPPELAVLAGLPSRPHSTASGRKDTVHTTHGYKETPFTAAMRTRVRMGKTRDCSTEIASCDSPLMKTYPFCPKNKRNTKSWVVRAHPSEEPVSLGGLWGRGSGPGSSLSGSAEPRRVGRCRLGGLDVQRGLLARQEPEHGGRHGLHVDLSTRDRA